MEALLLDVGISAGGYLLTVASKSIYKFLKQKEKDKSYEGIIKTLEANKKDIETELLNFTESNISKSPFIHTEIISKFDKTEITEIIAKAFQEEKISLDINKKISTQITGYKFADNLNHFNILILGRAGIGKSTLINSILELEEGTPEAAKTGIGKSVTYGEPKGYISDKVGGIRLWDSQGIDKEKYSIEKVIYSVKNLINIASINNDPDKFIHCIWYCVNGSRFEETERDSLIELMKIYDDETLPIVIVYTEAFYEEEYLDTSNEIQKVLDEKLNKKNIQIFQVVAKPKSIIVSKKQNISLLVEKQGIKELMTYSLEKIKNAVNSACFFSFKNKLKNDYKNEISNIKENLLKVSEARIKSISPGNKITNLATLNNQNITSSIKKLFNKKEISKSTKHLINGLLKKYQDFIWKESNKNLSKFLGKCSTDLILNYRNQIKTKNIKDSTITEDGNEEAGAGGDDGDFEMDDEQSIREEIDKNMLAYLVNKEKNEENKNKKERKGYEDQLMTKVQILFEDYVIKNSSIYLNNNIIDAISELMINSYNTEINKFDEMIGNIVKNAMDKQSEKVMENCKLDK